MMLNRNLRRYVMQLLLCLPLCASAQDKNIRYTVKGKAIDSASSRPVPYATITLTDGRQNILSNAFSNEEGVFAIQLSSAEGSMLEITSVGYLVCQVPVHFTPGAREVLLGTIRLVAARGNMEEVTVTARRKIIELRPGMLVYNAENDISNKGGTAADVLRKTPILNVDAQGNVTMRGSGNLKILINGKYSGQIARSPADALNMMPAENIKSVEVITTPSAKYDAEGAAGVINIITKKGYRNINGALELSASNLEQMFNPRISIASGKWNFSLHGHLHRLRSKEAVLSQRTQQEDGDPTLTLDQQIDRDNAAPHGSGDLAIVFTPDSLTEISFGMNTWFGKWPQNSEIHTLVRLPDESIVEQYDQRLQAKNMYLGSDINIAYNRKFQRPGQEITFLAQFTPAGSREPYDLLQTDVNKIPLYEEQNANKTVNREWTMQVDYIHPLSEKYSLESGIKMILRNVHTSYEVFADEDPREPGGVQYIPARSDRFGYSQDVWAGYSMFKANLRSQWYAEAGLRFEQTNISGHFRNSGAAFDSRFANFIPTATISKKISEDQSVSLSYTQRLTRPYIWDLNPNANAGDPKNIVKGNPGLQPEIARQAEFTYGINTSEGFFLNTALFWKRTSDAIVDFITTDANGISTTTKENLAANSVYGFNFSSSMIFSPRWSLNGNININYLDYSSKALQILRTGWSADIDANVTLKLSRQYSLQAFADYNSRVVTLQGYGSYNYHYSVAAKKMLPGKKLTITLAAINPFNTYIPQRVQIVSENFRSLTENRYFNRAFKLTLNWEFGGMFGNRQSRKITNDDVKDQFKG